MSPPETFERVQRVIADTGYAPNMLARGLTQGRSHTLGVVTYGLDYFGPSRVLTGIEQRAAELGYAISLTLLHEPGTVDVDGILNGLVGRQVDGIIWAIAEIGGNRAWSHEGSPNPPVPVTLVGGMAGQTSWPSIGIDNRAIGRRGHGTPDRRRCPARRDRHGSARLVGGAGATPRLARGARCPRDRRGGPARRGGRLGRAERGARAGATAGGTSRASTRCLPATTRWPSGSSTRPTRRAGGSPMTCPWWVSTTSLSRRTSGRR